MIQIDFKEIVREAIKSYDSSKRIVLIDDISAKVSTNHVYKIRFDDGNLIIAKLSYFGKFEHFVEDHTIINSMANNLPVPFENVLARSLMKGDSLFVHRHQGTLIDAWVVFYKPMRISRRLPKKLEKDQIIQLARSFAQFHKACDNIRNTLPPSSKTMESDIYHLLDILQTNEGQYEHRMHLGLIEHQCNQFLENVNDLKMNKLKSLPVFVDWNIGNFSVTGRFELFSRWDYDWFRVSTRMMDFYFFSRVVSAIGDKTVFSYEIDRLMEDRFILFMQAYHEIYPFKMEEILLLKEAYRFFLLNYVIKYGRYFFHEIFATRLQQEAYQIHLPAIDEKFDPEPLLKRLKL